MKQLFVCTDGQEPWKTLLYVHLRIAKIICPFSLFLLYNCMWICTLNCLCCLLELTLKHSLTPTQAYRLRSLTANTQHFEEKQLPWQCISQLTTSYIFTVYMTQPGNHWRKSSYIFITVIWWVFYCKITVQCSYSTATHYYHSTEIKFQRETLLLHWLQLLLNLCFFF